MADPDTERPHTETTRSQTGIPTTGVPITGATNTGESGLDGPSPRTQGQRSDMKPATETISGAVAPPHGMILEADLQAHIGRQLRAVYDEVVNEAVPDRFRQLLDALERKKSGGA